jgi:GntR family transcriptional regulator, transcriptional repressor for pyruvate dehydrogenase complex
MLDGLQPIKSESLKDVCIRRFEELILSGAISVGERLPPERELAKKLGVSRPVVHETIVDLATKGLVSMTPRIGTVVNDYRRQGSIALLTSLLEYHKGKLNPKLLDGMLNMRLLVEMENARLAAKNRTDAQLAEFDDLLRREAKADHADIEAITQLDFEFHLLITITTDNLLYPLLINSFKPVYTNLTGQFFKDISVVPVVFEFHRQLVDAIKDRNEQKATEIMYKLLTHGEERLREIVSQ